MAALYRCSDSRRPSPPRSRKSPAGVRAVHNPTSNPSSSQPSDMVRDRRLTLVGGLFALAMMLAIYHIHDALDGASLWSALALPNPLDVREIVFHDSLLPRIAMTLLCGGALGLAGTLTQQV